jgi:hypothetical protein
VEIEALLDRLLEASVSVWLDGDGKLRIDKEASAELKDLVREHKQELVEFRRAYALIESWGVRMIRLPLGELALAYPPRANLDEIRWAAGVLRLESMPLVIDDEGFEWFSYDEWRRRQPLWTAEDRERYRRERAMEAEEQEKQEKLKRRRKTA